jgi:2-amino-4-hydroxy-6-hydroxymethyldihydropteridine diphosphokinase
LDLLYAGRNWIQNPRLEIPHPRMGSRRFVMEPLAELCPGLRIAGLPGTVWETACWLRKHGEVLCRRVG